MIFNKYMNLGIFFIFEIKRSIIEGYLSEGRRYVSILYRVYNIDIDKYCYF